MLAAAAMLACAAAPALACEEGEVPLFGCQTFDVSGAFSDNAFAFCAGNPDSKGDYQSIAYESWTPAGVELVYPENRADGRTHLFFHHYFESGLYRARIRFESGGYTYRAYYDDNPPGTDPDDIVGPTAGVQVLKDGRVLEDIACGERPSSYFDEIRKATSCDTTNPHGEKACAADPPAVK